MGVGLVAFERGSNDKGEGDDAFMFKTDKQKGFIPALEKVFPSADNKFCVKHLHKNIKSAGSKKLTFKIALWNAC